MIMNDQGEADVLKRCGVWAVAYIDLSVGELPPLMGLEFVLDTYGILARFELQVAKG